MKTPDVVNVNLEVNNIEIVTSILKSITRKNKLDCQFSATKKGVWADGDKEDIKLSIRIYKGFFDENIRHEGYGLA